MRRSTQKSTHSSLNPPTDPITMMTEEEISTTLRAAQKALEAERNDITKRKTSHKIEQALTGKTVENTTASTTH